MVVVLLRFFLRKTSFQNKFRDFMTINSVTDYFYIIIVGVK